jgi:hypothetical protein
MSSAHGKHTHLPQIPFFCVRKERIISPRAAATTGATPCGAREYHPANGGDRREPAATRDRFFRHMPEIRAGRRHPRPSYPRGSSRSACRSARRCARPSNARPRRHCDTRGPASRDSRGRRTEGNRGPAVPRSCRSLARRRGSPSCTASGGSVHC